MLQFLCQFTVNANLQVCVIQELLQRHSIRENSIAVLTPYAAQKNVIRELLQNKGINNVRVLSIVESQGNR